MRKGTAALLLLCAVAGAADYDAKTLAAVDAELSGDFVRALELYTEALDAGGFAPRRRLTALRERGFARWLPAVDACLDAKRYPEAASCLSIARFFIGNHYKIRGAAVRLEREDVAVPDFARASGPFFGREGGFRWELGPAAVRAQDIVDGCLRWLRENQGDKGLWKSDLGGKPGFEIGVTGLAMLALLTQDAKGREADAARLARAADALVAAQARDGLFGTGRTMHFVYNHCVALEALAEHAILFESHREKLQPVLASGRDWLLAAQNPGRGWRYNPRSNDNDTSATSRAVAALDRAHMAGVEIPKASLDGALAWVTWCTKDAITGYNQPGGACARPEGLQDRFPPENTLAMTAAGAYVRAFCGGWDGVEGSLAQVAGLPPERRAPDMYYWWAATRAFRAAQGSVPLPWYEKLVETAAACAAKDGSIDPVGPWGADGGRVYATAVVALALAAPYADPPRPRREFADFVRHGSRTILVPASGTRVETGIYVDGTLEFEASVRGKLSLFQRGKDVGPEGERDPPHGFKAPERAPYGCLLAYVGDDGKPVPVGEGELRLEGIGPLRLFVNVSEANAYAGVFTVQIRKQD